MLRRCCLVSSSLALLALAVPASATTLSFHVSGITLPDDDSGVTPDVTVEFDFDPLCSSGCTLRIDMVYNDVNGASGLPSALHALAGVSWDPVGSITVSGASLIAPTLVGSQSGTASSELPDLVNDGVAGDDVTGHWTFRDDLENALDGDVPSAFDDLGNHVLSSVGDLTFAGVTADVTGMTHLLSSGACVGTPGALACTSSVESNPPDGIPFGIVDPDTTSVAGAKGDKALAQTSTVAFLDYDGTLSDVENVRPHFGTDGVVPEPALPALLASALGALVARRRRGSAA